MNLYKEAPDYGNKFRDKYSEGITNIINNRRKWADNERELYSKKIITDKAGCRKDFYSILGWPLFPEEDNTYKVNVIEQLEDDLCIMYRLQLITLKDLTCYAMLFMPKATENPSITLFSHGGLGTPELCAGFFGETNYNDMIRRLLRRGNAVLAPQLLLWDQSKFGSNYNRTQIDIQLKQVGSSVTAIEIFCFSRWIDYLYTRNDIKTGNLTMAGLSYGGFYTLFTAACDIRIKGAYSSCFFNDRYKYDWEDWTWFKAGMYFLDAEIAGLICPRPLYIEIASDDELFSPENAKKHAEKVRYFYETENAKDKFIFNIFKGTHEFDKNDQGIDFILKIK
jgi:dienelactone hydrolase